MMIGNLAGATWYNSRQAIILHVDAHNARALVVLRHSGFIFMIDLYNLCPISPYASQPLAQDPSMLAQVPIHGANIERARAATGEAPNTTPCHPLDAQHDRLKHTTEDSSDIARIFQQAITGATLHALHPPGGFVDGVESFKEGKISGHLPDHVLDITVNEDINADSDGVGTTTPITQLDDASPNPSVTDAPGFPLTATPAHPLANFVDGLTFGHSDIPAEDAEAQITKHTIATRSLGVAMSTRTCKNNQATPTAVKSTSCPPHNLPKPPACPPPFHLRSKEKREGAPALHRAKTTGRAQSHMTNWLARKNRSDNTQPLLSTGLPVRSNPLFRHQPHRPICPPRWATNTLYHPPSPSPCKSAPQNCLQARHMPMESFADSTGWTGRKNASVLAKAHGIAWNLRDIDGDSVALGAFAQFPGAPDVFYARLAKALVHPSGASLINGVTTATVGNDEQATKHRLNMRIQALLKFINTPGAPGKGTSDEDDGTTGEPADRSPQVHHAEWQDDLYKGSVPLIQAPSSGAGGPHDKASTPSAHAPSKAAGGPHDNYEEPPVHVPHREVGGPHHKAGEPPVNAPRRVVGGPHNKASVHTVSASRCMATGPHGLAAGAHFTYTSSSGADGPHGMASPTNQPPLYAGSGPYAKTGKRSDHVPLRKGCGHHAAPYVPSAQAPRCVARTILPKTGQFLSATASTTAEGDVAGDAPGTTSF